MVAAEQSAAFSRGDLSCTGSCCAAPRPHLRLLWRRPAQPRPRKVETVTVTGVGPRWESALEIKQNASQIIDSIVAEDIGKLPDNTVVESLQHVTGISIVRNNVEPTTVLIRGLPDIADPAEWPRDLLLGATGGRRGAPSPWPTFRPNCWPASTFTRLRPPPTSKAVSPA